MDMIILNKAEVEKIANSFNFDEKLTFVNVIDFEPDCKIYKLKNNTGDNYILICRGLSIWWYGRRREDFC